MTTIAIREKAAAKTNDKRTVRIVALRGRLLAPGDVGVLAKMPTKEAAISQLRSEMKAPV